MDVRLSNGDVYTSSGGGTVYISGLEEAVQRVMLAVSTQKGSFRYDRSFGTDYSELSAGDVMLKEKLDMRVKEATAGIEGTDVEALSVDAVNKTAQIRITHGGGAAVTAVDLNGYI